MVQSSYRDVGGITEMRYEEQPEQGDLVTRGECATPAFDVVAVVGDKAWVRNTLTKQDGVVEHVFLKVRQRAAQRVALVA